MSKLKSYILNRFARKDGNYTSWMSDCPFQCEVVEAYAPTWQVPDDAGIVITHMHYRWEEVSALRRIYESTQVPILILSDGVLEYRNTWENGSIADGAVFQPLIGHKLACIGRGQARTIESWGNIGKCEIVGMPRIDGLANRPPLPIKTEGPFRLLIATANAPAFSSEQRQRVVDSLRALKNRFEVNSQVRARNIEVAWRLTDGLEQEVGVSCESDPVALTDALDIADAVITTPSTLYLESVMQGRPTAILDFTNAPAYVPSAWSITAPQHIDQVMGELENPPSPKMLFQRSVLHDQLELGSSATRMFDLIRTMVKAGVEARRTGQPIELPLRVLSDPQRGIQQVETEFDARVLYPDNPSFRITEVDRLQHELSQAITRLGQLPVELDQKDSDIDRKESHIEKLTENLRALLTAKNNDLARKSAHIESLSSLFQDANANVKKLRSQLNEQATAIRQLQQLASSVPRESLVKPVRKAA